MAFHPATVDVDLRFSHGEKQLGADRLDVNGEATAASQAAASSISLMRLEGSSATDGANPHGGVRFHSCVVGRLGEFRVNTGSVCITAAWPHAPGRWPPRLHTHQHGISQPGKPEVEGVPDLLAFLFQSSRQPRHASVAHGDVCRDFRRRCGH